jgi:nitronate monooxygenase
MWQRTEAARRLGIGTPIVQGPFGGGLSSIDLVVAVSEAGGLGSFGVHHLAPGEIADLAVAIRSRTSKPFALNLWVSNHDPDGRSLAPGQFDRAAQRFMPYYRELAVRPPSAPAHFGQRFDDQVQALLDAAPPVFSFVFGVPSAAVLAECRRRHITTIGAVTTVDEALAMEAAGVDVIVASGFEAGGHRPSFLRPAARSLTGTLALVPAVVDRVSVPVVAAGGIADGRGIAAALMLGAQGAQIGTAFLACEESNASQAHRAALFSENARETTLTRAFTGRLARSIRNRFVDDWSGRDGEVLPYPIQSWFTGSFRQAAIEQGRADLLALWAGQGAPLLEHRRAEILFKSLVDQTSAALDRS